MRLGILGVVAACVLTFSACGSSSKPDGVVAAATTTTAALTASSTTTTDALSAESTTSSTAGRVRATTSTTRRATNAPGTTATTAASGTVVSSTNNASYGEILVDGNGRTLYLFTPDNGMSSPQCTGSCAETWPPLKATGTPRATGGAHQSMLGVQSGQVTYNGHPLYRYAGDSAPGQTNGQGVAAIWYVVSTSGDPVLR